MDTNDERAEKECPTCGPTTAEPHPRRLGVARCGNCKEQLHSAESACMCGYDRDPAHPEPPNPTCPQHGSLRSVEGATEPPRNSRSQTPDHNAEIDAIRRQRNATLAGLEAQIAQVEKGYAEAGRPVLPETLFCLNYAEAQALLGRGHFYEEPSSVADHPRPCVRCGVVRNDHQEGAR